MTNKHFGLSLRSKLCLLTHVPVLQVRWPNIMLASKLQVTVSCKTTEEHNILDIEVVNEREMCLYGNMSFKEVAGKHLKAKL